MCVNVDVSTFSLAVKFSITCVTESGMSKNPAFSLFWCGQGHARRLGRISSSKRTALDDDLQILFLSFPPEKFPREIVFIKTHQVDLSRNCFKHIDQNCLISESPIEIKTSPFILIVLFHIRKFM